MTLTNLRQQIHPAKFVALLFPFLAAIFVMPRILQYDRGDGLLSVVHKGNLALGEMVAVTSASIVLLILLDVKQRMKKRWRR